MTVTKAVPGIKVVPDGDGRNCWPGDHILVTCVREAVIEEIHEPGAEGVVTLRYPTHREKVLWNSVQVKFFKQGGIE